MRYPSRIETATATFSCPACGQRFIWRPHYAGRALSCRCGHTMSAPSAETYDLADEETSSARYVLMVDDAGVPSLEPAPPRAPPVEETSSLPYEIAKRNEAQALRASWIEGSKVKDLIIPALLVLCGTMATYARMGVFTGTREEVVRAFGRVGAYASWNIVLMLVGIILAAKVLDVGFGLVPQALLKLAALTLGPLGVWQAVAQACGGGVVGEIIGWLISVPVYWWLFGWFCDLDFRETMICFLLITMRRWGAVTFYWFTL